MMILWRYTIVLLPVGRRRISYIEIHSTNDFMQENPVSQQYLHGLSIQLSTAQS